MERRDDARRTPGDRDGGGGVTIGDHMLMRAIDPALVAHPFVCPLPITVGGGTIHLSRAVARSLVTRLQQMEREQREALRRHAEMAVVT